ncbi:ATP-binding protein (plasmid) [Streptomycetaceae bacterium NBC_01309]
MTSETTTKMTTHTPAMPTRDTELPVPAWVPAGLDVPSLIVLIGAAGAGKSTVAAAFPASWRLSLDACRQQVSDDAGDQTATPDAANVRDHILSARLSRGLPTVLDATHTDTGLRQWLAKLAFAWEMPAVAITVRTLLEVCQARQAARPENRQVPLDTVATQHAAVPTAEQLYAEGFGQVCDAAALDLLGMLLARSAATPPDMLADVRAAFGDDLADVFAFDPDSEDSHGVFAVAGREITVRWWDGGGAYAPHWQARIDTEWCGCGGYVLWATVVDAVDLLAVYRGEVPDDLHCDRCDVPA